MSVLRRLFGTQKAIDDLTDKDNGLLVRAGKWVDHLNYTDEEKAEASADVREWGLRLLEALEPFKVVQRILAFGITGVWALIVVNCLAALWVEAFTDIEIVDSMLSFIATAVVSWPITAVMALYFSGGVLPGLLNSGKK